MTTTISMIIIRTMTTTIGMIILFTLITKTSDHLERRVTSSRVEDIPVRSFPLLQLVNLKPEVKMVMFLLSGCHHYHNHHHHYHITSKFVTDVGRQAENVHIFAFPVSDLVL